MLKSKKKKFVAKRLNVGINFPLHFYDGINLNTEKQVCASLLSTKTSYFEVRRTVALSYNYHVNNQSTQPSVYHLMQHVSILA